MKSRFRCNGISILKFDDLLIEEVEEVKVVDLNHCIERFQEQNISRPKLHGTSNCGEMSVSPLFTPVESPSVVKSKLTQFFIFSTCFD